MESTAKNLLWRILGLGLFLSTVLVTPSLAFDPINPIKMLIVVPTGFMCFALVLANRKSVHWSKYRFVLGLLSGFVAWQIVVLVCSGAELNQQMFGTNGRNTGLITYLAFALIFMGSIIASSINVLTRFVVVSLIVGVLSLSYGIIQAAGSDPIDWVNPYSPVFGFLGNPNFQSSLLGILGSIVFAKAFEQSLSLKFKLLIGAYLLVTVFVIMKTASQQGFLVLVFGVGVVVGLYVMRINRVLGLFYGLISGFGLFLVLFGVLNKGPLASLLFKQSVTYRGDYWRAGWNMTLDHPIFGVGMDSYGDWYRRSRTIDATLRRGPDITSNAAHNVFLDISSYGGFPLLLIYLSLMVLVIVSIVKVLKRSSSFNPGFAGIVAGWVGFQAQSIISINQIGLAIWGWVLAGLIIGYEINTRDPKALEPIAKKGRFAEKPGQTSAASVVAIFIGFILGISIGMPPYVASARFKGALESGNPQAIRDAAYFWPQEPSRMILVAETLDDNKFSNEGLRVALDATVSFPENFGSWAVLNAMDDATPEQKSEALAQMKRLDPLNPNLK